MSTQTKTKLKGKFYECGICDCIHPWDWDGDCRDDANRLNLDDIADDAELVSWEDRQAADDEPQAQHSPLPLALQRAKDALVGDSNDEALRDPLNFVLQPYEPKQNTKSGSHVGEMSMDEHDPLLAAYNDGDGNQTGQPQHQFNKGKLISKGASHDLCSECGLSEEAIVHKPQAEHSPLPAKWHDCEVAEKQIKLLQQQANQAQALAEDAAYWRKRTDEYSLQLASTHNQAQALAEALRELREAALRNGFECERANRALANWEGAK